MDTIFINALKVNCIIGILPNERVQEQELIVDIKMEHSLKEAVESGDLSLSINYAQVATFVEDFIKERKALLLETLAHELCALILKNFKPKQVTLRLTKTQAVAHTAGVGIEITRTLRDLQC